MLLNIEKSREQDLRSLKEWLVNTDPWAHFIKQRRFTLIIRDSISLYDPDSTYRNEQA